MIINITPVPKPRMTQRDKWAKSPRVLRYWAFCEEIRLKIPREFDLNGCSIEFGLPMPKSWSKKKQAEMSGQPHTQVPDLDNIFKALGDALYHDDSGIHTLGGLKKVWSYRGYIAIDTP